MKGGSKRKRSRQRTAPRDTVSEDKSTMPPEVTRPSHRITRAALVTWGTIAGVITLLAAAAALYDSPLLARWFAPNPRLKHLFGYQAAPLPSFRAHASELIMQGIDINLPLQVIYAHTRPLIVESIYADFGDYNLSGRSLGWGNGYTFKEDDFGAATKGRLAGECSAVEVFPTEEALGQAQDGKGTRSRGFPLVLDGKELFLRLQCVLRLNGGEGVADIRAEPVNKGALDALVPLLFGSEDGKKGVSRSATFTLRTNIGTYDIREEVGMFFLTTQLKVPKRWYLDGELKCLKIAREGERERFTWVKCAQK